MSSFITEKQPRPSKVNGNRHDTREVGIDPKKVGPTLSKIRKPNLDPSKVEKLLQQKKALLEKKKEESQPTKKNGFR